MTDPTSIQIPLGASLKRARTPEQYHAALRSAQSAFDELNSATIAGLGLGLACRDGCWICCHLRVDVFAHEVFLLADFVRKRFAPAQLKSLMERLTVHSAKVIPMEPIEHVSQNIRCPMLQEDRCSVYAARPLACRRQHSLKLAPCDYVYGNPGDLDYELGSALAEALTNPACWRRWRDGKKAFLRASVTPPA